MTIVIETPAKPATLRAVTEPSFVQRLLLAWRSFFRILFDPGFAARWLDSAFSAAELPSETEQTAEHSARHQTLADEVPASVPASAAQSFPSEGASALHLLSLLQREGRLIDFLQQDVEAFSDTQIGQAARVVHEGCRATLKRYVQIEPILDQPEGEQTTVASGFRPAEIKLLGNVSGTAPFRGKLRHKGWKAASMSLPETLSGHAFDILAPAEVELG